MLTGLGHRAIGRGNHQNRAVHLRGAGNHVLYIVGMARAVYMRIVALIRLILHVRSVDGNTSFSLFRSLINIAIFGIGSLTLKCQHLGNRSGQSGLTMVNVANGTNVNMGFVSLKFSLRHFECPPLILNVR